MARDFVVSRKDLAICAERALSGFILSLQYSTAYLTTMPFRALNSYETDLAAEKELLTLEHQLEEAIKDFCFILKLQGNGDVNDARNRYQDLFEMDVMRRAAESNAPPAGRKLKAVALKNWAILEAENGGDLKEVVPMLVSSLELDDSKDESTIITLSQIALSLGWQHIGRLGLEELLSRSDGVLSLYEKSRSTNSAHLIGPSGHNLLNAYKVLLMRIEDNVQIPNALLDRFPYDNKSTYSENEKLEVQITSKTWASVIYGLEDALRSLGVGSRQKRLGIDPYSFAEKSAYSVVFTAPHGEAVPIGNVSDSEAETEHEAEEETAEMVIDSPKPTPNPEHVEERSTSEEPRNRQLRAQDSFPSGFFVHDYTFFDQMKQYLDLLPIKDLGFENLVENQFRLHRETFEQWDDQQADQFLSIDSNLDFSAEQPVMQMLDFAARGADVNPTSCSELPDSRGLSDFLATVIGSHFQEVRVELIVRIFGVNSLILSHHWPESLFGSLQSLVYQIEPLLVTIARSYPQLAEGVYELFANFYIGAEREMRTLGESPKRRAHALDLLDSLNRWRVLSSDLLVDKLIVLRHAWVSALVDQLHELNPDISMQRFETILDHVDEYEIEFPNYAYLPTLSRTSCHTQISKFKAASVFSKIFESSEDNLHENTSLLEAILMPDQHPTDIPEHAAIAQFLNTASPQFRLNLWYLLLDRYESINEPLKTLEGLLEIMDTALDAPTISLNTLSVAHNVSRRLILLLTESRELVTFEVASKLLNQTLRLLPTLQAFLLFDSAVNDNVIQASQHPSWESAAIKFRELVIYWWTLFLIAYRELLPRDTTPDIWNDLLSIVHERLGVQGYCMLCDNILVKFHISELLKLSWHGSDLDMAQCLHCCYGFNLSAVVEGGTVVDHHTKAKTLTLEEAQKLLPFTLGLILGRRNVGTSLMRTDVRQVLTQFQEALGVPPKSNDLALRVSHTIEHEKLSSEFFKKAWQGYLVPTWGRSEQQNDLWFTLGWIQLTHFKSRARQTQAIKVEELQDAVKFFELDLGQVPLRFESWFALSQTYDLISEHVAVYEPDAITGQWSHHALVTAAYAVSCLRRPGKASLPERFSKSLVPGVWTHFGRLLWLGVTSPLNERPLDYFRPLLPWVASDNTTISESMPPRASRTLCLRLAICSLEHSLKFQSDWSVEWLLAKIGFALGLPPHDVLKQAIYSSVVRCDTGTDPMPEASQCIVTLSTFYYHEGKITSEEAKNYIQSTSFADGGDTVDETAIRALKKLVEKRKWLHRPHYYLAKIYEHQGDINSARLEMMNLVGPKSTKPLQIWRTDLERPGQRLVYMSEYVKYLADLMFRSKDDKGLLMLLRKFRRFPAMYDSKIVWEYICSRCVSLIRDVIGFLPRFSDREIFSLNSAEFDVLKRKIEVQLKELGQSESPIWQPWVLALHYALEIKRLNNGQGPPSAPDDLVICLYLRMLLEERKTSDSSTNQLQSSKRVLRRDVLLAAQQSMRPLQARLNKIEDLEIPMEIRGKGEPNTSNAESDSASQLQSDTQNYMQQSINQ